MSGDRQATQNVRVEQMIADLARLRSTDPAARHAVHAIKLARLNLESFGASERRQPDG